MTGTSRTVLRWGGATDVGRARTVNQDAMLLRPDFFVLADGMGGHQGGEVASQLAIEAMAEHYTEATVDTLIDAVHAANDSVFQHAREDPSLAGMGTTLVTCALVTVDDEDRIVITNVGDSRAYVLQGGELLQVTDDHSLVAELVRDGRITAADAEVHPQRNILTRALGVDGDIDIDEFELLPFAGDRFVLCSDGLFNEVPEADIAAVLRGIDDPTAAAEELVRRANEGGGRDNITVIVVDVVDDGGRAEAASVAIADDVGPDTRPTTAVPVASSPAVAERAGIATDREPEPEPEAGSGTGADDAPKASRPNVLTIRSVGFTLILAGLVVVVGLMVTLYARGTFFVGVDADSGQVAVYQGRPGGVLWLDPTVVFVSPVRVTDLPERDQGRVRDNVSFGSEQGARDFVARLTTTTVTTTTTTVTTTTTTTTTPGGG